MTNILDLIARILISFVFFFSGINLLKNSRIDWLDSNIDKMNALLPPLNEFVLPGGSEFTARVHIARSECRGSERAIIALSENECVPNNHKKYINNFRY